MEWALFIPRRESLHLAAEPWRKAGEAKGIIRRLFGPVGFSRLYFGQEFCEKAIPGAEDLLEAVRESRLNKMDFTLVTPYVTEKELVNLEALLEELASREPGCEVVVNDWGVLYLLNRRFPTLKPVLGRLLNKMLRNPRLLQCTGGRQPPDLGLFRSCSLAGQYMEKLLKALKVGRVELDIPFQGLDDGLMQRGYKVSLYVPHACITTGRSCLIGSWGLEQSEKFRASGGGCSRECRFHRLEMHHLSLPAAAGDKNCRIIQTG